LFHNVCRLQERHHRANKQPFDFIAKTTTGILLALLTVKQTPKQGVDAKQRRPVMKNLLRTFQKNMMAATFAEAGEWDTAREMTPATKLSREPTLMNKIFMAVTFAESGLHDEAIRIMGPTARGNRGFNSAVADDLGLHGIKLMYGTVSI
jgi:hypothetical protein